VCQLQYYHMRQARNAAPQRVQAPDDRCGSCSESSCATFTDVKADALLLALATIDLAVWPAHGFVCLDSIGDHRKLALFLGPLGASLDRVSPL
jgi:hypothetical protein